MGNGGAFFSSVVVVCSPPLLELALALIGCVGVVESCKSNSGLYGEPQTVDFYTADLYLILLSDQEDNFTKYIKNSYRLQL